jgi:hypothetical protein
MIPKTVVGKIEWFENRLADWAANAAAIGSSAGEITALQTKTTTARASYLAQQQAQAAAKSTTLTLGDDITAMMNAGSDVIKKIRAKAATDGNSVYALANIPAPALPSPMPPPGTPTDFKVSLDQSGALELKWKCPNPPGAHGTIYQVYRRTGAEGEFTYLGGTGEKKFLDATIPVAATSLTYQIQAARSTAAGPWAQFNVNFGTNPGGAMTASVSEPTSGTTGPKIAA